MDPYLAARSRSIAPAELGRRIRAARLASGMTQAQVAAGVVTAAHVSRVERGERRPTTALLAQIAKRLNTTPAELLNTHAHNEARARSLRVEQAAVLVATGDWHRAEAMVREVLDHLDPYEDDALRATAVRVQAEALFGLGDINAALTAGESIVGDRDVNSLRALILLCRCHCALGSPSRAIAVGNVAQDAIRALAVDGLGESLSLAAAVAEAHYLQGRIASGDRICRDALASVQHVTADMDASRYLRAAEAEASVGGATPAAIELTTAALTILEARNGLRSVERLMNMR